MSLVCICEKSKSFRTYQMNLSNLDLREKYFHNVQLININFENMYVMNASLKNYRVNRFSFKNNIF